jgi:hypothetical protein
VLSDPRAVLSAWRLCCQCLSRSTTAQLCGLLIKIFGLLFGEFDGEEGLHAGIQVETFAGPARSDRLGVEMLEAVHRSKLIMLGCPCSAAGEVEMSGQILITHPRLTRLPIRLGEHPTVSIAADGAAAFVDCGVMPAAQQHQIIKVCATARRPGDAVVGLQVAGLVAAGILTHPVPDLQGAALPLAHQTPRPAKSHHLAVLINERTQHRMVAGQPLRGSGLDRTQPVDVAHRSSGRGRSRGNVPGNILG